MVSFIGVAVSTLAYCGALEKTSIFATAAIPRAAAIPIPTPANIDLFTGNPPENVTTHFCIRILHRRIFVIKQNLTTPDTESCPLKYRDTACVTRRL